MEAKQLFFLWVLGGAALGGLIGAVFGGVTSALTTLNGRAAGGILGRTVAQAFARISDREPSPLRTSILVGCVDGAVFLALLGGIAGGWAGSRETLDSTLVVLLAGAAILFPLLAIGFGLVAYGLTWLGVRMLGIVCTAGLAAGLAGYRLAGAEGIMIGVVSGSACGMLIAFLIRRRG